jgi:multiple sugar transport system substrate-binding protein
MKLRKMTVLMLTAAMTAGLLAGCGGAATSTTAAKAAATTAKAAATTAKAAATTAKAAATTAAAKATTAAAKSGGAKTVITIWSKDRHDEKYVQSKVDEYNKNNKDNIQVDYKLYTDNYIQAVDLAVQSGELPDVLVLQDQFLQKYASQGQWADLYKLMDADMKTYFKDEVYKGINEMDGKLYYIPTCGTTGRLIYNTEIFSKVGIKEPPKTLKEMVDDAALITSKLSKDGIYGFAGNFKGATSALERSWDFVGERELGVKKGFDFKKGEYDFTGYATSLGYLKELLSDKCAFPGCESLDIDPLRTQFANGKIGMYISWTHAEPGVYKDQFPMDSAKWNAAPIPTSDGKENGKQGINFTSAYLINAKGKNVEKAFKAYKDIFTTESYLTGYYEGGYGISIVPQVIKKAKLGQEYSSKPKLQMLDIDAVLPREPHEINAAAVAIEGQDYCKTFESIYYGGADPTSTLKDLTDRYNKAYKDGISKGLGKEVKIPDYNPLKP